jgi:16S rRNA (cytosine967-C5)-methyltransferase
MPSLKVVSAQNPREIALRILQLRPGGQFIEELFDKTLANSALVEVDRRLCQELSYGVVRWQGTIDWLIARKTANRTQKPLLQNLLRLGLYQIFWLDRVPKHAAVHETVELAKQAGFGPQAGFVNAILRGYTREFDGTRALLTELKEKDPHLGYSHPEWLTRRWKERWGTLLPTLLEWNNRVPKTYARVNTLKIDAGKMLTRWREEDVEYDFVRRDWLQENLVFELKTHPPFEKLESFRQGCFYIQDPSTLLSVEALSPQPGETILDLCAAPGGKLTFLAQRMQNQGRVAAFDPHPERIELIKENCLRLGVTCADFTVSVSQKARVFDKILVDAPCSNTGVMRRRVDLRWRIQAQEIERLTTVQQELLAQASSLLKAGGLMVYSTCSLEPEENEKVVNRFLEANPEYRLEFSRQLTPFANEVDGAFVASLRHQGG